MITNRKSYVLSEIEVDRYEASKDRVAYLKTIIPQPVICVRAVGKKLIVICCEGYRKDGVEYISGDKEYVWDVLEDMVARVSVPMHMVVAYYKYPDLTDSEVEELMERAKSR